MSVSQRVTWSAVPHSSPLDWSICGERAFTIDGWVQQVRDIQTQGTFTDGDCHTLRNCGYWVSQLSRLGNASEHLAMHRVVQHIQGCLIWLIAAMRGPVEHANSNDIDQRFDAAVAGLKLVLNGDA